MTDTNVKARNCAPVPWPPENDAELVEWSKQRKTEYETTTLLDRQLGLAEPEIGNDIMVAAARDLRSRGINLVDASHDELLDALLRVSP